MESMKENIDLSTIESFGHEWHRFDQTSVSDDELQTIYQQYFNLFPWSKLSNEAIGFDLGCGSGRWAKFVARRVKRLHCIDPSKMALNIARQNLKNITNCDFHLASVNHIPLLKNSMDFGYSLGVLHHIPDTIEGIKRCVEKLKPGAPFLLYLYYNMDNKPIWYRSIWYASNILRKCITKLPYRFKYFLSQLIAILVYFPIARFAYFWEKMGRNVDTLPLAYYRKRSLYIMRNDSLDRFGTPLEKRFSKNDIREMMIDSGLEDIKFSNTPPFWCAVGYKKSVN